MYLPFAGETTHIPENNNEMLQLIVKSVSQSVKKMKMGQFTLIRGLAAMRRLTMPS